MYYFSPHLTPALYLSWLCSFSFTDTGCLYVVMTIDDTLTYGISTDTCKPLYGTDITRNLFWAMTEPRSYWGSIVSIPQSTILSQMIDDMFLPYSLQIMRTLLQSRASVGTRFIKHDPKMSFYLFLRLNVSFNSDEARSYFGVNLLWSTLIFKFCSVPVGKGNGRNSEINAQCTLSLTNWNIVLLKQAHGIERLKSHIK